MEWNPLSAPGNLIAQAARSFSRIGEARLKPLGFGIGQMPVLMALKDGAALSQKQLAQFARIEQPSMAQMLARMERDRLIARTPDPSDGRSSLISLTYLALERLDDVREILLRGNDEALAGLTGGQIAGLSDLLVRLNQNLRQVEAEQSSSRQATPPIRSSGVICPKQGRGGADPTLLRYANAVLLADQGGWASVSKIAHSNRVIKSYD